MDLVLPKLFIVAALLMTLLAAIFDWRRGVIPRLISLPFLAVAPFFHALALSGKHGPFGLPGPVWGGLLSLLGAVLCACVPYLLFRFGWVGGGDVKVLASLGALLGPHVALPAEFYALLLAALFTPTRLAYQGRLFTTIGDFALWLLRPLLPRERVREAPDALWESVRLSPFVFLGTATALFLPAFFAGAMP
jgi:Flp pilus assembly protein protease CpaA